MRFLSAALLVLATLAGPVSAATYPTVPPGVTLTQPDGGPTYYADHGYTNAVMRGWDSPSFFPIGPWIAPIITSADAQRWAALGWNTAFVPTTNSSQATAANAGISVVQTYEVSGSQTFGPAWTPGPETVGLLGWDEPSSFAQGVSGPISTTPDSAQGGRFLWDNNTWNVVPYGPPSGTPGGTMAGFFTSQVATPGGVLRNVDIGSFDWYLFSGASISPQAYQMLYEVGVVYGLGGSATPDQARRALGYGDAIDSQRVWQPGRPILAIVENGGPSTNNATLASYIQPTELPWAVWMSIIHGARGVVYFNSSFGGPYVADDNLSTSGYSLIWPGQTVSMFAQTASLDAQVKAHAPIILSQAASGYATVSPASGEIALPPKSGSGVSAFSGIDIVVKRFTGGPIPIGTFKARHGYYIYAATRDSESATNIPATFTLNDPAAFEVQVVGENRTIPVVKGVFSDTFAQAWVVHIYRVKRSKA